MWSKSCNTSNVGSSENKYHKAARDGNVVLLSQGTKRDFSKADEDGMTPVHWAAYDGKLEALRIITGRGGNPDSADVFGNTPLHYAAKNNHLHCVSYLINFGCNIWSIDNDGHSALDLAGLMEHDGIVRYLDAEMACRLSSDQKKCEKLKLKSIDNAKKRIKWNDSNQSSKIDNIDFDNDLYQAKRTITQKFRDTFKKLNLNNSNISQTVKSTPCTFGSSRLWRSTVSMSACNSNNKSEVIYDKINRRDSIISSNEDKSFDVNRLGLFERPGFGSISFRHLDLISMFSSEDNNTNSDLEESNNTEIEKIDTVVC